MEEAASGIDCQETKLDKALEEIIEKEKAATDARSLQDDNNKKTEKAAAKEHRNRAVERLGETKKMNAEKQDEKAQTAKKGRRSTSEVVQFLNNNNISFICMTIIIQLQYCKSFNIKLQFITMIMQCNDYYSQSSVISMIW